MCCAAYVQYSVYVDAVQCMYSTVCVLYNVSVQYSMCTLLYIACVAGSACTVRILECRCHGLQVPPNSTVDIHSWFGLNCQALYMTYVRTHAYV